MTATTKPVAAGGVQLVDTPGRPARAEASGRGEHAAGSVLSLNSGAGPDQFEEDCVASPRRPARPVRFDDAARNAAYWARIERITDDAPPLTDDQRARIRAAFHQPEARRAAA